MRFFYVNNWIWFRFKQFLFKLIKNRKFVFSWIINNDKGKQRTLFWRKRWSLAQKAQLSFPSFYAVFLWNIKQHWIRVFLWQYNVQRPRDKSHAIIKDILANKENDDNNFLYASKQHQSREGILFMKSRSNVNKNIDLMNVLKFLFFIDILKTTNVDWLAPNVMRDDFANVSLRLHFLLSSQ